MAADMDWMAERAADRLDPRRLLPGARTVVALACNYCDGARRGGGARRVARYARGRDYHATLRDRLRALRRLLRAECPGLRDYGSVDHGPFMEKVWAARAGLGVRRPERLPGDAAASARGSCSRCCWSELEVDAYADGPTDGPLRTLPALRRRLSHRARSTGRGGWTRGRCLSYQTIENEGPVPLAHREAMAPHVFGCDVCQDVCPLNAAPLPAPEHRFLPRAVAGLDARALAALTARVVRGRSFPGPRWRGPATTGCAGTPPTRSAPPATPAARPVLEKLAQDPSAVVSDAARWALARLPPS